MTIIIGPTFGDEIRAAGLSGLPFSWASDGQLTFGAAITADQRAAIAAVLAAHDPRRLPVRVELERRIVAGVRIVSNANHACDGVYAIDDAARANIMALAVSFAAGLGLPNGQQTVSYPDMSGVEREFTAEIFMAFAAAVRDYVYNLKATARQREAGVDAPWPDATAVIA